MSTSPQFDVVRADAEPDLFHVTGRKVTGTVRARIDIEPIARASRRTGGPAESIDVTVLAYAEQGCGLTVNGIAYVGHERVQVGDPDRPFWPGYGRGLFRADNYGAPTDAARSLITAVAARVARLYWAPEAQLAARVRDAEAALVKAREVYTDAADALAVAEQHLEHWQGRLDSETLAAQS